MKDLSYANCVHTKTDRHMHDTVTHDCPICLRREVDRLTAIVDAIDAELYGPLLPLTYEPDRVVSIQALRMLARGTMRRACGAGEPEENLVLTHKGVSIYHTMTDAETESEYWLSVSQGANWESTGTFDWRELPDIPVTEALRYEKEYPNSELQQRLAYAIDLGAITEAGRKKAAPGICGNYSRNGFGWGGQGCGLPKGHDGGCRDGPRPQ